MGSMFSNDSRQFKFDVLTELAAEAYQGEVDEAKVQLMAKNMVSLDGPRFRCCVYKEREVLRQRVRLACGEMADDAAEYNPHQIIQVIDAACDGCTIRKIRVTDNCRKCMAKACMASCRFGAISMGSDRAQIDYAKCKECTMCARACPYNAIVVTERPCSAHCPVDAITWDRNGIASIDEKRCINCGQCMLACPFGAIEDISWVVPVITLLRLHTPTYAIVAPSIQGQFENATLAQIMKGIEMLGFEKCYEVAAGADAVAAGEYEELKKHMAAGKPMTTSCCTAFVNMMRIHYPKLYQENTSTLVTPMMALARKLKQEHPDHGVVFIGPCLAKKQEAMENSTDVDYVLTFEELLAMLIAKKIDFAAIDAKTEDAPSNYGRGFAMTGGVAAAVQEAAKEHGDGPVSACYADGVMECKKQLMLMQAGRFDKNILEGMGCTGGCIGGPACISPIPQVKARMAAENKAVDAKSIQDSLKVYDFSSVDMFRDKEQ
jgi:ferredoxin hydrogenase large subunit